MKNEEDVLNLIEKQFLCATPLKEINWPSILENASIKLQGELLNKTVNSALVLKHPISINYQKLFTKTVIQSLEKQASVIHDDLYEAYGRLVALPTHFSYFFKHYLLRKSNRVISLKENINLISDGTTGLRTWQASLALSEWALQNKHDLSDKAILELGSGIGLTGLAVALECNPSLVYFTDCHPTVLETLCDNIRVNIANSTSSVKTNQFCDERCLLSETLNSSVVRVLNLPWEDVSVDVCKKIGEIDVIFAADVVYDNDLFGPLINAVNLLFRYCGVSTIIFACTERNEKTLDEFLSLLIAAHFQIEELDVPEQEEFIWCKDTPVKLFSLRDSFLW